MAANAETIKQKAHALIDGLPEDATWADLRQTLAVIEDIEAGLKESDAGLGDDTNALRRQYSLPAE